MDETIYVILKVLFDFALSQNFFVSWFTNPPTVIFPKVGKKNLISKKNFYFICRL